MYEENYDEYIKSVLGYSQYSPNDFEDRNAACMQPSYCQQPMPQMTQMPYMQTQPMPYMYEPMQPTPMSMPIQAYTPYETNDTKHHLEKCYPEVYKVIYPMVTNACQKTTGPVTEELVNNITEEIYFAVESDTEIKLNINLTNATKTKEVDNKMKNVTVKKVENREETKEDRSRRRPRNTVLNDLIKVLVVRELIGGGRPPVPPHRPPMPPHHNHRPPVGPPFPGGPGPGRPPFRPR